MENNNYINEYLEILRIQKKYSDNTIIKYKMVYKEFTLFLKEFNLDLFSVQTKDVKNFLHQLYERNYKYSTISNYISSLKGLYKYLYENKLIPKNVMTSIKYPKKENKLYQIIYTKELEKFFQIIDQDEKFKIRNKALFLLLYSSGIRISECVNLKLNNINKDQKTVKVLGKGNKERIVPISEQTYTSLMYYINTQRESLKKVNSEDYLFLNKDGNPITDRGVRYITTNICNKAGLYSNISPHKFRHTLATSLLNSGMDLRIIQEILGHESLVTTQKYTHINSKQIQDIYDKNINR